MARPIAKVNYRINYCPPSAGKGAHNPCMCPIYPIYRLNQLDECSTSIHLFLSMQLHRLNRVFVKQHCEQREFRDRSLLRSLSTTTAPRFALVRSRCAQ